ncbi:roadblock/LC7 domain-containing protein [Nonomuraea sp. NPDC050783]|uniref:roadblock/LC7 domain-containing protein n=1 Tax=Nonomuraea sp. NPDC050783 TaxID=3154634 RepID=UPI0034656397
MTTQHTADTIDMTGHLDRLVTENDGLINAMLFTTDGLLLARSRGLGRDEAERTAAMMAGLQSLQRQLAGFCGVPAEQELSAPWRHMISDLSEVTVLLFAAGERTGLAAAVRGGSTTGPVAVAIQAIMKTIRGLQPVLGARERSKPS